MDSGEASTPPKEWLQLFLSKALHALPAEASQRLTSLVQAVRNGAGRVKLLTLCSGTDGVVDTIQE